MRKLANKPHYPVSNAIFSTEKNTPSCNHPNRPYWWQPESLQAAGARRSQHPPLPPPLLSMLHDEVGSGLSLWFLLCLFFFFLFLTVSVYQQSWISLTSNFTEEPSETYSNFIALLTHVNSFWKLNPKTLRFVVQTDFHIFPGAYSDRPSFWLAILVYIYQGDQLSSELLATWLVTPQLCLGRSMKTSRERRQRAVLITRGPHAEKTGRETEAERWKQKTTNS